MEQFEPPEDRPALTPYPRAHPRPPNLRPLGEHPITIALPYIVTLVGVGLALSSGDDFPNPNRSKDWVAVVFLVALVLAGWSSALAFTLAMADRFKNRVRCVPAIINCLITWSALFASLPFYLIALIHDSD